MFLTANAAGIFYVGRSYNLSPLCLTFHHNVLIVIKSLAADMGLLSLLLREKQLVGRVGYIGWRYSSPSRDDWLRVANG
jgi:hypothetical protein